MSSILTNVIPQTLTPGDVATILGIDLGNAGIVYINGYEVPYDSWTDTEITVTIPTRFATDDTLSFMIRNSNGFTNSILVNQKPDIPTIVYIQPPVPEERDFITIYGDNFGQLPGAVYIGGTAAQLITWADKQIECFIPDEVTEYAEISVHQLSLHSSSYLIYIKTYPRITGIHNPVPGQELTVNGSNFGSPPGKIYINDTEITPISWTETAIKVIMPVTGPTATVRVINTDGASSEYYTFKVNVRPVITGHEPIKTMQGKELIIIGENFQDHGRVLIGGLPVTVLEWMPPSRVRVVPLANLVGTYPVVVECDGLASAPYSLTFYPAPEIRGTSPVQPIQRSIMVVEGVNFGDAGVLLLNYAPVAVEAWSDTKIVLKVPANVEGTTSLKVLVEGEFSNEFIIDVVRADTPAPTYHIWNEPLGYTMFAYKIEEDDRYEISVGTTYRPGVNELAVYVNGMRQVPITEATPWGAYVETDSTKVTFDEPLMKGDIVMFEVRRIG